MSADGAIRIRGLDQVLRGLRATEGELKYATRIVTNRAALKVRAVERETVPGKRFDDSIQKWSTADRATYRIGSQARVATQRSIIEGRSPGHPPSIRALVRWIESRGMAGSMTVKTRRVSRRKLSAAATVAHDRAVQSMAHRLQKEILQRGTAPIPYVEAGELVAERDLERYMREAVEKAVRKFRGAR